MYSGAADDPFENKIAAFRAFSIFVTLTKISGRSYGSSKIRLQSER
jgi:hypothetical protein